MLTQAARSLEAATSRLEDIATPSDLPPGSLLNKTLASPPNASAAATPPPPPPPAAPKAADEPLPESVEEFDNFLETTVDKYVKLSKEIGGNVEKQAAEVSKGFLEQRKLVLIATKSKKPSDADLPPLFEPINKAVMAVMEIKDVNHNDPNKNHLASVADGIMLLGWIAVTNRPFKHVDEVAGSAQFYGNRVLKEYKEKDPKHVEWIQSFYAIFKDLSALLKDHLPNGLPWNPQGGSVQEAAKSIAPTKTASTSPPAPASGGAPPPPPPPPPGPPPVLDIKTEQASAPAAKDSSGGFGAVFSELNKGEAVTKGLRKVDKSEMTHKNPSLRAAGGEAASASRAKSPAPGKKPKPESMRVKKPAKKELEGNKWTVVSQLSKVTR